MKANQKFIRGSDEAVSPVIAVILMVAITVVLAATVYVWVSGFGSQSSQPAKSMALSSAGTLSSNTKSYTVSAATSGMKWSDIRETLNGAALTYDDTLTGASKYCVGLTSATCVVAATWNAGGSSGSGAIIVAGQTVKLGDTALGGETLRILGSQAHSVVLTLTVGRFDNTPGTQPRTRAFMPFPWF